jgi:hypothetical protein
MRISAGNIKNGHAKPAQTNQKRMGLSERNGSDRRPAALTRQAQNLPVHAALIIKTNIPSQHTASTAAQRLPIAVTMTSTYRRIGTHTIHRLST